MHGYVFVLQGRSMSPKLYRTFSEQDSDVGAKLSGHGEKMMSCEEILMVVHPDKGSVFSDMAGTQLC